METRHLQRGLKLYFPRGEQATADIVEEACRRSVALIRDQWGLQPPARCRVYVMTSWLHFLFHSAPWYVRVWYAVSLPLWFGRIRKLWGFVGGWTQRYRRRPAIGVKPPRLLAERDRTIGEMIFVEEPDLDKKLAHIVCHELTHAFSARLKLPMWLNEGIAMIAVDRYFGQATVKEDTRCTLSRSREATAPGRYRELPGMAAEDVVYQYVRGYWITRFLQDTHPDLLHGLLQQRPSGNEIESGVAAALGVDNAVFWSRIDRLVVDHFTQATA